MTNKESFRENLLGLNVPKEEEERACMPAHPSNV